MKEGYQYSPEEVESLRKWTAENFERVRLNDVTVSSLLRAGRPLEEIVIALVDEKERCFKRIMALEAIAPRKIVMPDGRVLVWHCPDDLVPTDLTPNR